MFSSCDRNGSVSERNAGKLNQHRGNAAKGRERTAVARSPSTRTQPARCPRLSRSCSTSEAWTSRGRGSSTPVRSRLLRCGEQPLTSGFHHRNAGRGLGWHVWHVCSKADRGGTPGLPRLSDDCRMHLLPDQTAPWPGRKGQVLSDRGTFCDALRSPTQCIE